LCRGQELFQRPTAVPVSIALGKDLLPAGPHLRILSAFSHGKELFQHDLLVAVSVVPFKDFRLHRSGVTPASRWFGVARSIAAPDYSMAIAWGVACNSSVAIPTRVSSRSVAISLGTLVTLTAGTHLANLPTELCHLLLQLHDHAIQRRFAFRLRAETTCRVGIALSSRARLRRIASTNDAGLGCVTIFSLTLTPDTRFGRLPSFTVAFSADTCFG
jgi:hypothetical protein